MTSGHYYLGLTRRFRMYRRISERRGRGLEIVTFPFILFTKNLHIKAMKFAICIIIYIKKYAFYNEIQNQYCISTITAALIFKIREEDRSLIFGGILNSFPATHFGIAPAGMLM